ncbi:MAG TPA: tripartite tricarboxylate transporter TctB family protein, partial [Burkholderiales bacterium]|nr:tripartite tricarboxylate transporter TctB family protein [Burkholderiales bacterium]
MQGRLKAAAPYAALLVAAAYLFRDASHFAYSPRPGELGPDFWPKAVLILLMLACGWELLARIASRSAAPRTPPATSGEAPAEAPRYPRLLAGGAAATLAYVLVLPLAGFFVSTALYLALFMRIGRYRRYGVIAATSLIGSLAFVFVFMRIVYVSLPLGVGPFQKLSLLILAVLGI